MSVPSVIQTKGINGAATNVLHPVISFNTIPASGDFLYFVLCGFSSGTAHSIITQVANDGGAAFPSVGTVLSYTVSSDLTATLSVGDTIKVQGLTHGGFNVEAPISGITATTIYLLYPNPAYNPGLSPGSSASDSGVLAGPVPTMTLTGGNVHNHWFINSDPRFWLAELYTTADGSTNSFDFTSQNYPSVIGYDISGVYAAQPFDVNGLTDQTQTGTSFTMPQVGIDKPCLMIYTAFYGAAGWSFSWGTGLTAGPDLNATGGSMTLQTAAADETVAGTTTAYPASSLASTSPNLFLAALSAGGVVFITTVSSASDIQSALSTTGAAILSFVTEVDSISSITADMVIATPTAVSATVQIARARSLSVEYQSANVGLSFRTTVASVSDITANITKTVQATILLGLTSVNSVSSISSYLGINEIFVGAALLTSLFPQSDQATSTYSGNLEINVGQWGTALLINTGIDLTRVSSLVLVLRKPDKTEITRTPQIFTADYNLSDGGVFKANQFVSYVLESGDIDQAGKWGARLDYSSLNMYLPSSFVEFTVGD